MSKKLGMDPEQVRSQAGRLNAQLGSLDEAAGAVKLAQLASASPLSYGLLPGGFVIAPLSFAAVTSAAIDITLASVAARAMIAKVYTEVFQQEFASQTDGGWMDKFLLPGAVPFPLNVAGNHDFWSFLTPFGMPVKIVNWIRNIPKYYAAGVLVVKGWGIRSVAVLKEATTWIIERGPKWIAKMGKFLDTPWVKLVGKSLSVVGTVFSGISLISTLTDPDATAWDITRDSISLGLSLASTILLFTPLAPIGVIVGAVGLVWNVAALIVDNHEAIGKWIGEAATNVGNFTTDAAKNVGNFAADAAKNTVKAGTEFVGAVQDAGRNVGEGIHHAVDNVQANVNRTVDNVQNNVNTAVNNVQKNVNSVIDFVTPW